MARLPQAASVRHGAQVCQGASAVSDRADEQTPRQRDAVITQQADSLFAQGRYIQAADLYAQSSKSFEHVVLALVDRNERDALRNYLHSRLSHLRKTDLTQRMMLATWLVEIFLAKLNDLEDVAASEGASEDADNVRVERAILEDDLRDFLRSHKVCRGSRLH